MSDPSDAAGHRPGSMTAPGRVGTGAALVDAGGRFMTGAEMAAAASRFGMQAGGLYFRGRVGAVGDVTAAAAVALIGIFPAWVVELTWQQSAALPTAAAVEAYAGACADWGRQRLAGVAGLDRLATLADRVVDAAEPSALLLFAAWRARPRPQDEPARAAFGLMLLRELRGGLHFAALRTQDVDVPLAVTADPRGGEARLRRTAWRDEELAALLARAAADPGVGDRWRAAEELTDTAFSRRLAVLDPAERAELAELVLAADAATAG